MADTASLQPASGGTNKKRKRASDAGHGESSPKRAPMNGDHLDQGAPYGAEFVQHLQNATHGVPDAVGNGLGPESQSLPYPTNGESQAGSFEMSETHHQGTPYVYQAVQAVIKHRDAFGGGDESPKVKPAVGTAEWHRNRKDCHKEVERRRRETINEGIMSLANIVPDCEKAKGAILQRAVNYVHELRNHIETLQADSAQTKGTLEGLLSQLTAANEGLRATNDDIVAENERLKMKLQSNGINPDDA